MPLALHMSPYREGLPPASSRRDRKPAAVWILVLVFVSLLLLAARNAPANAPMIRAEHALLPCMDP